MGEERPIPNPPPLGEGEGNDTVELDGRLALQRRSDF